MEKFKIGDIVRLDLEKIKKLVTYTPDWYSNESLTIIKFRRKKTSGNIVAHFDKKLQSGSGTAWIGFLMLDILEMRKKKLKKLDQLKYDA